MLWLELPGDIDSEWHVNHAISHGISIAPGLIFAPCSRYKHCIRLSFGHAWTGEFEEALRWLGRAVTAAV